MHLIIDVETNTKSDRGMAANPFDPRNHIVMIGLKLGKAPVVVLTKAAGNLHKVLDYITKGTVLVGHNIKFDLHYLRKDIKGFSSRLRECSIWDTQSAEYILSGQTNLYPSLDECAVEYGGTLKDSSVKDMWSEGIETEAMPQVTLKNYLIEDIKNTYMVYNNQLVKLKDNNQLKLNAIINYSILCTEEMEYNGMYIDTNISSTLSIKVKKELDKVKNKLYLELNSISSNIYNKEELLSNFNFASPLQVKTLIYGGKLKYKHKVDVGFYKTGKRAGEVKYKNEDFCIDIPTNHLADSSDNSNGSVNEAVLKGLSSIPLIDVLLKYRKQAKDYDTYFVGIDSLKWRYDSCIHHNLNHCATKTGRLSSTEPNLQNIPRGDKSDVKHLFTSRFGKDGLILVADYSQLEICALAHISGDEQLIEDIIKGTDCHTIRAAELFGVPTTKVAKEQRQIAKGLSFQLQYGSGAKAMAASHKIHLKVAKKFIENYYKRYPQIKQYQDDSIDEVKLSREPSTFRTDRGLPAGIGYYTDEFNRRYYFREYDTPDFMLQQGYPVGFSPTEIKNLRIQGYATGNIVPLALGKLYSELRKDYKDTALLVNTVHDNIMLDIHKDMCNTISMKLKEVMESVPALMKTIFGIEFRVPLKVDITAGTSWANQEALDVSNRPPA